MNQQRPWLAWGIVAAAAIAVAVSFVIKSGDDTPAKAGNGPKATPVAAAPITRGAITERGRYPGELDADAADVAAFFAGRLVSITVRVGDNVEKNAVIAELDPVDAREQVAQARAQAKAAEAEERRARVERDAALVEVRRLEPLVKDKLIAELEIDKQRARANSLEATVEAAAAGGAEARARVALLEKRLTESRVRAPFSGRIAERYVDPGAIVAAGARLVRLVQVSPLRVRFEVPEADVPGLVIGTALRVVTKASAEGVAAKVTGVGSEVSRDRRVATAEALIDQPPSGWLPGMYAEAVVDRATHADAMIVPAPAVLSRLAADGRSTTGVFVDASGTAKWIAVRVVARDGERVAIDGPVDANARVLVRGHVDLVDGARIKVDGAGVQ